MEFFKQTTRIDFLGKRFFTLVVSAVLLTGSVVSLVTQGLNFGIDFTGGTLVEVGYEDAVEIEAVRGALAEGEFADAVVQNFGTASDVLVRLPAGYRGDGEGDEVGEGEEGGGVARAAAISARVIAALRAPYGESLDEVGNVEGEQLCVTAGSAEGRACRVQMRRVEFVGPQVGDELANQGGLAMLYALIGILIYVTLRFEWRFAVGSVIALVHDVLITLGVFSAFQFDFSLPVLAAVLAVIGYSLNDTIVVYDRIRENFRAMRRQEAVVVINSAINQTLPRTALTSVTTLAVVLTLLIFGGEVIRGFSIALLVGVLIGTYSSIFVASPAVVWLGITREDMLPVQKEGVDANP